MLLRKNKVLRQVMGVLETMNFLFIRLAIKNPSRLRMFPGKIFREYMSLVADDKWICRDILDIVTVPHGTRVILAHLAGGGIDTAIDELAYLALIAKSCEPANIFEIGTFRGRTALNFALNSPEDCTIWTLDLPPDDRESSLASASSADAAIIQASKTGADYKGTDCEKKIRQLYGNSLVFDFSPYLGRMDIVFVDGAHHFEIAKSDSLNALRMVRPGGLIVWHDFANYGDYNDVTRAILDVLPGDQIVQVSNTQLAVYKHGSLS
jgi:predicted O-methyltransferase YrrM